MIGSEAVINDPEEYRKIAKAQSELEELVAKYREWKQADGNWRLAADAGGERSGSEADG